jgi:hypothetical protein
MEPWKHTVSNEKDLALLWPRLTVLCPPSDAVFGHGSLRHGWFIDIQKAAGDLTVSLDKQPASHDYYEHLLSLPDLC